MVDPPGSAIPLSPHARARIHISTKSDAGERLGTISGIAVFITLPRRHTHWEEDCGTRRHCFRGASGRDRAACVPIVQPRRANALL
jgi:hypothetical protein